MSRSRFHRLVGASDPMQKVYERVERFARSSVPILVTGETGTGKELVAHAVWEESGRIGPLVAMNCAAIPDNLVDSELFGHERGAFTGAMRGRAGMVARASGGILFLDEIAEMLPGTQAKLLRTLETGEYRPVGSDQTRRAQFRLLAASHANLDLLVAKNRFRADLFHRLGAVRIHLPPLRERAEDIPLLVRHFIEESRSRNTGASPIDVDEVALSFLRGYRWPGNVRQLRNVVEAAAASASAAGGRTLGMAHLTEFLPPCLELESRREPPSLEEGVKRAEARLILAALRRTRGNRKDAAHLLVVSETTLHRKLNDMQRDGRLPASEIGRRGLRE
jgi:DNA-binding NtrC family response regulator